MFEETDSVLNSESIPSNVYKSFKTYSLPLQNSYWITETFTV
jgi:hypothetical protein